MNKIADLERKIKNIPVNNRGTQAFTLGVWFEDEPEVIVAILGIMKEAMDSSLEWTQERFDKEHQEPHEYGEAWAYVVAGSYTDEQAAEVISEWENDLSGEDHKYSASDIVSMEMTVGPNPEDDNKEDWILHPNGNVIATGKGIYL